MKFSFIRKSYSVFITLDVYWACDFFLRSGDGGGCITSWGIYSSLLTPTPKGGCMVPLKPLVEGSGLS